MNTKYLLFLIIISFSFITATEIKNSSLNEGLIAYYSFEETGGNIVFDELQIHNETRNGALQNQKGIVGNCYYYDGIDDYVTLSSIDLQTSNTWSNNVWVYYKGIVQYTNIIRMENKFINFYDYPGNNKLIFWYYDQNQKGQEIKTSVQIADVTNRWVMSTLTYDGYTLKYYIDGKLISSIDTLINQEGPIERQFISKSEPGSNQKHYTRAYVDELGFWNRALSSEEITLLYNEGKGILYKDSTTVEIIVDELTNIINIIRTIIILSIILGLSKLILEINKNRYYKVILITFVIFSGYTLIEIFEKQIPFEIFLFNIPKIIINAGVFSLIIPLILFIIGYFAPTILCPNCLHLFSVKKISDNEIDNYKTTKTSVKNQELRDTYVRKEYEHKYNVHVYKKTYKCSFCDKITNKKYKKYDHLGTHVKDVSFEEKEEYESTYPFRKRGF